VNVSEKKIKKDLLSLYLYLYPQTDEEQKLLSRIFSEDFVRLLKYPPSEVEAVLAPAGGSKPLRTVKETSSLETVIHGKEDVHQYFEEHLQVLLDPTMPEERMTAALSQVSLHDLKYLYSCLLDVPLSSRVTKKELLYKIRDFFNAEKRTSDLSKTLY